VGGKEKKEKKTESEERKQKDAEREFWQKHPGCAAKV
jgi:hypothetical protein